MNILMQLFFDIIESFLMEESALFDYWLTVGATLISFLQGAILFFIFLNSLSTIRFFDHINCMLGRMLNRVLDIIISLSDAAGVFSLYHHMTTCRSTPPCPLLLNRLNEDSWTIFVRGIKLPPAASAVVQLRTYFQNYVFVTVIQ